MGRYGKGTNFHIVIIGRAHIGFMGGGGGIRETEGEGMTGENKGDEG